MRSLLIEDESDKVEIMSLCSRLTIFGFMRQILVRKESTSPRYTTKTYSYSTLTFLTSPDTMSCSLCEPATSMNRSLYFWDSPASKIGSRVYVSVQMIIFASTMLVGTPGMKPVLKTAIEPPVLHAEAQP